MLNITDRLQRKRRCAWLSRVVSLAVNLSAVLVCAFGAGAAQAADGEAALKRFLEGVQSLQANFSQVQSDERGKLLQSSTGRMWLARPGRFRWNYARPYVQEIVCDGSRVWLYDPDLAQVTVRPAEEALKGTPAALLSQRAALVDAFKIEDAGSDGRLKKLVLKPRSADSDFKQIELWLDGDLPMRMKFLDPLGGSTEVSFSDLSSNRKLDAALFRFTPPKGVEVVEGGTKK